MYLTRNAENIVKTGTIYFVLKKIYEKSSIDKQYMKLSIEKTSREPYKI